MSVTFDKRQPPDFFAENKRLGDPVEALNDYFRDGRDHIGFTGSWFDRLADAAHPNQITATDIVAVSTLSIRFPANSAIWILGDGAHQVTALLEQIPPGQAIWDDDANLSSGGAASALWHLLQENGWPDAGGLGPVTAGKLLSGKRPHLIPIYDSFIRRALFKGSIYKYWDPWFTLYRTPDGNQLRELAAEAQAQVPLAHHLSILRVVDIVIWHWAHTHPQELSADATNDSQ